MSKPFVIFLVYIITMSMYARVYVLIIFKFLTSSDNFSILTIISIHRETITTNKELIVDILLPHDKIEGIRKNLYIRNMIITSYIDNNKTTSYKSLRYYCYYMIKVQMLAYNYTTDIY